MNLREKIMMYMISKVPQATGKKEVFGDKVIAEGIDKVCRQAAAEGIVMLKNDGTLPLTADKKVSIFGRVQYNYFYVGYGSGGDVCVPYKVNLLEGMRANPKLTINEDLAKMYVNWCEANPVDDGFWGNWPRFYEEMPVSEHLVKQAREQSDLAMVVIGRAAGEDRENNLEPGSFYLTEAEKAMLDTVTAGFEKTIIIIDSGNVIDLSWIEGYGDKIAAVLFAWQGGMESGNALADILSGDVTPSGRLTDTIAMEYKDYPSAKNFGKDKYNNYAEDIYVGYRYFETFAKDKVHFPFGYGLSYTEFDMTTVSFRVEKEQICFDINVTNRGDRYSGAEVVQVYVEKPQGKLGQPARALVAFDKTQVLAPGASQVLSFVVNAKDLASYDDAGVTGYKSAYVLEAGEYIFHAGRNVRDTKKIGTFEVNDLRLVDQLEEAAALERKYKFKRMVPKAKRNGDYAIAYEMIPTRTIDLRMRILENLPKGVDITGDKGIKLQDVANGSHTLDEFVAQLSVEELEALSRGEGLMGSSLGSPGNAGAFGGVTESLRAKGITPVITTDGPAGIRLQYYASQLPCGTALASTFNKKLVEELGQHVSREMVMKGTDVLLSPGMNIHRDPLCGRNFEYYSEDPYLTGWMATAMVRGVQSEGVSACVKHFACNNQETNRNYTDSRLSERALREIYLKGFEICVKNAKPKNLMSSYNKINGIWAHYHYDLCTTILRKEWGFTGNVVTDWWMRNARSPYFKKIKNNAYRIQAQVDVLMPGSKNPLKNKADKRSYLKSYKSGRGITLGEMQRSAKNTLRFVMDSYHFNHKES